ncbi:hypothetical protein [Laceyella putida]|uniref:Uncharacterized protein n=1 Tax=Laceyella putida TaxID=110101 RepID=A0ABW2RIX5_9BACL
MINPTNKKSWHVVVLAFVLFGAVIELMQHPEQLLLPIIIVGIVFYLYKFPPRWLLRLGSFSSPLATKRQANPKPKKRKKYPFRVIEGNNKKKTL